MQFNSYIFGVFFAIVLAVYNAPFLGWRGQKIWLLVTSYLFYAAWDPVFIVLVWLSTIIDYTAAAWIWSAPSKSRKRLLMVLSVVVNIGILAYFKYGNFVLENLVHAAHALGIDYQPARHDIVLPIGISFYTYTLDVYLGRTATRSRSTAGCTSHSSLPAAASASTNLCRRSVALLGLGPAQLMQVPISIAIDHMMSIVEGAEERAGPS